MQRRRISAAQASARSCAPGFAAVEEDQRVQVAVAGVKDVGDADAVLRADIASMPTSASPSRLRGTTPSWTMKSGLSRPTAENADLRPFQIARALFVVGCATRTSVGAGARRISASRRTNSRVDLPPPRPRARRSAPPPRPADSPACTAASAASIASAVHDLHRAGQEARARSTRDTASPAACERCRRPPARCDSPPAAAAAAA